MVQGFGLQAVTAEGPVQSLIGELKSHEMLQHSQKKKKIPRVIPLAQSFRIIGQKWYCHPRVEAQS